jgi:hypothetical protein
VPSRNFEIKKLGKIIFEFRNENSFLKFEENWPYHQREMKKIEINIS